MTSITNEDELDYIRSISDTAMWIGLEKNVNTGTKNVNTDVID